MTPLERSYRRLMLAYPAAYRRRDATEIVTTLLEMSPPARRRPPAGDAWHLLAAGVRQRFRLPSRRPLAWAGALLFTLVLGAFGAAAGSWAAAQTYAGLPSRDGYSAVSRLAAGPAGVDRWQRREVTPHAVTLWWSDVWSTPWNAADARTRLARAGWALTPVRDLTGDEPAPVRRPAFDGTRDGLHLRVVGTVAGGEDFLFVSMWPQGNASRWPLTVGGALIGLLAGWPLAASLAYRLRRTPAGRARLAAGLTAAAVAAWLVPAAAC